ncbi:MAG: type I-C CRISPR-associated protein Cas8c/Csd1 [Gammaproteobacteria bacterium]|nr:type I-C CRISPR-associated protein Cas8c/Csd1 [Gammaproteobacteria bacterium]
MSWISKLYDTYPALERIESGDKPWPVSHFVKNAHVEVVLDNEGNLKRDRCKIINGIDAPTLIPATESSAGRAGDTNAPHPLCEELGYCAGDLPTIDTEKFGKYVQQLSNWTRHDSSQIKLHAILTYANKKSLYKDLSDSIGLPIRIEKKDGTKEKIKDEKIFVRWRVEVPGEPLDSTWEDKGLIQSWIEYDKATNPSVGFCFVTGENTRLANNHSRFLRRPGDGAKIVSSNDDAGYTFRGRFTDSKTSIKKTGLQGCGVSYEVSQKAHNALRRLIARQGHKFGESKDDPGSVIVAWAVSGNSIPDPMADSFDFLGEEIKEVDISQQEPERASDVDHGLDLGQHFALSLKNKMAGYYAKLPVSDNIIIMGLDSATPGRMAITYYQEFVPQQYIDRIEAWHQDFAWYQRRSIDYLDKAGKSKNRTEWHIGTPSPKAIMEAIFGNTMSDSLKKNTIERLLPCIIEERVIPLDLVQNAFRRSCNRAAKRLPPKYSTRDSEIAAWEKELGIACALFKGFKKRSINHQKDYSMALEEDNCSRDYLYGRLLAIAEKIEGLALWLADEKRSTNAERLMQRFAERPASTWLAIRKNLQPYILRLNAKRAGYRHLQLMDEVTNKFNSDNFKNDMPLSGEFILAFHTQRLELNRKGETETDSKPAD